VIRAQQLPTRIKPFIIAQTANVTDDFRAACIASGMVRHARAHADRLMLEVREDEERWLIRLLVWPCPPPLPLLQNMFLTKPVSACTDSAAAGLNISLCYPRGA
jgi:CheY-like chemotaxis protein